MTVSTTMDRSLWRNVDFVLILAAAALLAYGTVMVFSVTFNTPAGQGPMLDRPVVRHLMYVGLGVMLFIVAASLDYRLLVSIAPVAYVVSLALLVAVLVLGTHVYGARRWLDIGPLPIQPSEIAKLAVILTLARFYSQFSGRIHPAYLFALSGLIVLIPMVLIYAQPDLGTMIVFIALWVAMGLMGGMRLSYVAGVMGLGLLAAPVMYKFVMKGYMRERLHTFLDPTQDPLGAGYNILQSEISVGSGGFWGKGFTQGTQTQLHFLRIQRTDFIFSAVAEEMGFMGSMLLFGLFILLLFRSLRAATLARDQFGRLVVCGVVTMILVHAFINIGSNIRLLPVTGIPLPLISYGGTSLLTTMFAIGIIESITMRHKRVDL